MSKMTAIPLQNAYLCYFTRNFYLKMDESHRRNFYSSLGKQLRKDGFQELNYQLQLSANPPPVIPQAPSLYKTYNRVSQLAPPPHLQNFLVPPPKFKKKKKKKAPPYEWDTKFVNTHKGGVKSVKFNQNGKLVVVGCDDSTLKVMQVSMLKEFVQVKREMEFPDEAKPTMKTFYDHSQEINDIVITKNDMIITASSDFTIKCFGLNKKKSVHYIQEIAPVISLALHPNDQYILTGTNDRIIRLYNLKKSKCYVQPKDSHQGQVNCLGYSRDGRIFTSGGEDGAIKVWDGRTNQCVRTANTRNSVFSTHISHNSQYLLSCGRDFKPVIWDLFTMTPIKTFNYNDNSNSTSMNIQSEKSIKRERNDTIFSNDEKKIFTSVNSQILIYDVYRGLEKILEGHSKFVRCLDFSPTDEVFVSGSDDLRSRLYARC